MTEIIFVRTRHVYDSYWDFWRLVELSNFKTCYVDEVKIELDNIYIVSPMNGEWRPHINNEHKAKKPVNAHLILWNLERPSGSAGSVGQYGQQCRFLQVGCWENGEVTKPNDRGETEIAHGRFIDEVWVSDRRLASETNHATRFVVLGSDTGLGEPGDEKKYRFCHMSYANNRRQSVLSHFPSRDSAQEDGVDWPSFWPWEDAQDKAKYSSRRDEVLKQSQFALNIHQDHHPFQEPLRFALFAAYGVAILSESIFDAFPWVVDEHIIFSHYDGLLAKLNQMSANEYDRWRDMGLRARERMCKEFQFGKMVRQAVEESVGLARWR